MLITMSNNNRYTTHKLYLQVYLLYVNTSLISQVVLFKFFFFLIKTFMHYVKSDVFDPDKKFFFHPSYHDFDNHCRKVSPYSPLNSNSMLLSSLSMTKVIFLFLLISTLIFRTFRYKLLF